jgi:hypothetical protein
MMKMTEKSFVRDEKEFAEECRVALEKSWGSSIPMPKSKVKKESNKKFHSRPL